MLFQVFHVDAFGERHPIDGRYEAESAEGAISAMLADAGTADDGSWEAVPANAVPRDTGLKRGSYPIFATDVETA